MKDKICDICCGTMLDEKCRACGYEDKSTMMAWMLIHMSLLLLVVASLNGSLV